MRKSVYAIYKGDTFIDLGTSEYLANKLGCKVSTIEYYATPTNKRKIERTKLKNNKESDKMIAIRIEDDE